MNSNPNNLIENVYILERRDIVAQMCTPPYAWDMAFEQGCVDYLYPLCEKNSLVGAAFISWIFSHKFRKEDFRKTKMDPDRKMLPHP